jgi:hypothetical protein
MQWVDAAILAFLAVAWGWDLPAGSASKRAIQPLGRIIEWLGLWHSWRMFLNPETSRNDLCVEVRSSDGSWHRLDLPNGRNVWLLLRPLVSAHMRKFCENARLNRHGTRDHLLHYVFRASSGRRPPEGRRIPLALVEESWPIDLHGHCDAAFPPRRSVLRRLTLTPGPR